MLSVIILNTVSSGRKHKQCQTHQELDHEMTTIQPGENPTHKLTSKPLVFLNHIKGRNNDRFSPSVWESFFYSSLEVPAPTLIGPAQQWACNVFHYDTSQVHDWVVYKLSTLLGPCKKPKHRKTSFLLLIH